MRHRVADGALLDTCGGKLRADLATGIEAPSFRRILGELNCSKQPHPSRFCDERSSDEFFESPHEIRTDFRDVLDDALALNDIEVRNAGRCTQRMRRVRLSVRERTVGVGTLLEHSQHLLPDDRSRKRQVGARQSLRDRGEIGFDPADVRAEGLAKSTKAADDFIGGEQDVVTPENLLDLLSVTLRWRCQATRAEHWLADKGGDRIWTLVGVTGVSVIVRELQRLAMDGIGDLAPAVTDVHAVQADKRVDRLVAVAIMDTDPLASRDDPRLTSLPAQELPQRREGMDDGCAVQPLKSFGICQHCRGYALKRSHDVSGTAKACRST